MKRLLLMCCFGFFFFQSMANADDPPLKVLFIGNSYTRVNDLPSMLVGLAEAADGRKIEVESHLPGGRSFEKHLREKKAVEKIQEKKWDVVVLQEQSLRPIIDRDLMFQYARVFQEEIKKQNAKTVFYLTWARENVPEMQDGADPDTSPGYAKAMYELMCGALEKGVDPVDFEKWCVQNRTGLVNGLNGAYFDIARELDAEISPVGIAWKKALAADKNLVLHRPDKSHPTATGTYLAACVFYATLPGKSPVGLPGEIKNKDGKDLVNIPSEEAERLQKIAWETVQEVRERNNVSAPSPQ